jgi:DNA-directed RNA polymerase subunit RPC12/RpoP
MFNPEKPLVLCRSAQPPEPIDPRFHLGYRCLSCGKPLQVSPDSIEHLRNGANPLCNACGLPVLDGIKAGKFGRAEIRIQPEACAQIERLEGKPIREVYPNAEVRLK